MNPLAGETADGGVGNSPPERDTAGPASDHLTEPSGPAILRDAFSRPSKAEVPTITGYTILGELGRGGMGVVYKARQQRPERVVALKMILAGGAADDVELTRFRREVEAIAGLQHPNLIAVYEVGEHAGQPYYAMECVEGGSLETLADGRPQDPRLAAEIVETISRAMHAVHLRGIVHRDLKPGNILLAKTSSGNAKPTALVPKITDFGLARRIDAVDSPTLTGAILGTPCYMAPEQATGKTKIVGPAVDIYALGAILYELLTGQPPFEGESPWETVQQVANDEPVAPRRRQPKVPADLEVICLKCLEKDPEKRYASAWDLAEDLRRFLLNEPIRARRVSFVSRVVKWSRRRPALAALFAVSVLAITALVAGGIAYHVKLSQALDTVRETAEQSRQRLVQLYVANGSRLLDDGDWYRALVWFVEALRLDEGHPDAEASHRTRIAATLRQCPRLEHVLFHNQAVRSVVFSPDGKRLLTASDDGTARIWDARTGVPVGQPMTHSGPVIDAIFSPDGARVATASDDGSARVWDAKNGRPISPTLEHGKPVKCVAFSPNGDRVLSAGEDGTARIWDAKSGAPLAKPFSRAGPVRRAAYSPDGRLIVTGSDDGTVRIWNAADGSPVIDSLRQGGIVNDVNFSPDGRLVIAAGSGDAAWKWDVAKSECVRKLAHRGPVVRACFSPDGKSVLTASDDHTGYVWTAATGAVEAEMFRHQSGLNTAVFSPDGRMVATGSDDNSARVWAASDGDSLTPLFRHNGSVNSVAFSPDGRQVATAGNDHAVRVWDIRFGTEAARATNSGNTLADGKRAVKRWPSADGRLVAVAEDCQHVVVRNAATNKALGPPLAHGSDVTHAAFSHDSMRLATASDDNMARIWNWATGELVTASMGHNGVVRFTTFSPDGKRIATVCADGTARVWDTRTGEALTPALLYQGRADRAEFDADGNRLTIHGNDSRLASFDLRADERSIQELQALAQLLSGSRIDCGLLPLETSAMQEAWRKWRAPNAHGAKPR